jgi:hypothetical protein
LDPLLLLLLLLQAWEQFAAAGAGRQLYMLLPNP